MAAAQKPRKEKKEDTQRESVANSSRFYNSSLVCVVRWHLIKLLSMHKILSVCKSSDMWILRWFFCYHSLSWRFCLLLSLYVLFRKSIACLNLPSFINVIRYFTEKPHFPAFQLMNGNAFHCMLNVCSGV